MKSDAATLGVKLLTHPVTFVLILMWLPTVNFRITFLWQKVFFTFAPSLFEIYECSGQHWPLTSPQGRFFPFSTDTREPTPYGALIVLRAPRCCHSHSNFLLLLRFGSNCGSLSCCVPSCRLLFPVWGLHKPEAFSSRGHHPDSTRRRSMTSKVASLGPFPWVCFFGSTKIWFSFISASKTK